MNLNTFIITIFCMIDDWLIAENLKLRKRGPQATMADSEVLTIEIVGAFMGIETDSETFSYFRRHYVDWFPDHIQTVFSQLVHRFKGKRVR